MPQYFFTLPSLDQGWTQVLQSYSACSVVPSVTG